MKDIHVLSGVWSRECDEGKQSHQPLVLGLCCDSKRTALPGGQLASSTRGKVVTGSASCWLLDNSKEDREAALHHGGPLATSFPFKVHHSIPHSISHAQV